MKDTLVRISLVCLALVLMYLSGCGVVRQERVQVPEQEQSTPVLTPREVPSPTEQSPETPPSVSPAPVPPPAAPPAPRASEPAPPSSQAVTALLETAEQRAQAGNLDSAAAVLERAVRLEPQNALLWHRLATLRLRQGQYAQAASLAAKSNALAGTNRSLQASNWDTIAQAKDKLGDAEGARAARAKAHALQ